MSPLALYVWPFVAQTPADPEALTVDVPNALAFVRRAAYGHLVTYVGVFLVLLGLSYVLDRYELLFSSRGAVFGEGAPVRTTYPTRESLPLI